jgi:hypothetical protein
MNQAGDYQNELVRLGVCDLDIEPDSGLHLKILLASLGGVSDQETRMAIETIAGLRRGSQIYAAMEAALWDEMRSQCPGSASGPITHAMRMVGAAEFVLARWPAAVDYWVIWAEEQGRPRKSYGSTPNLITAWLMILHLHDLLPGLTLALYGMQSGASRPVSEKVA